MSASPVAEGGVGAQDPATVCHPSSRPGASSASGVVELLSSSIATAMEARTARVRFTNRSAANARQPRRKSEPHCQCTFQLNTEAVAPGWCAGTSASTGVGSGGVAESCELSGDRAGAPSGRGITVRSMLSWWATLNESSFLNVPKSRLAHKSLTWAHHEQGLQSVGESQTPHSRTRCVGPRAPTRLASINNCHGRWPPYPCS